MLKSQIRKIPEDELPEETRKMLRELGPLSDKISRVRKGTRKRAGLESEKALLVFMGVVAMDPRTRK